MNTYIEDKDIRDCYKEDTVGRKYHASIPTKKPFGDLKGESSEPITMNLNKPMTWRDFKALSDDMKRMYLRHLRDTFGVNIIEIITMLGISRSRFTHAIVIPLGISGEFGNGRTIKTSEQQKAWDKFLGKTEAVLDEVTKLENVEIVETVTPGNVEKITSPVNSFKFSQTGKLNAEELIKRITALVDEGTNCTVKISLTVES